MISCPNFFFLISISCPNFGSSCVLGAFHRFVLGFHSILFRVIFFLFRGEGLCEEFSLNAKNEWDENFFWIGKKSLLSVRAASIREDEVA